MKKIVLTASLIAAALAVLWVLYGVYCDNTLTEATYVLTSEKPHPKLRIVFVTDQHNKQFGENDSELIAKIKELRPDIIISGGDMVTKGVNSDEVMKNLFSQLSKIAPTYCVLGNHELAMTDKFNFSGEIAPTGVILLDDTYVKLEKDGVSYILGGLTDFPYYEYNKPAYDTTSRYFWEEFAEESKNLFSILIHHHPEYISDILGDTNIDLVLCGHTHGGQIQLPFFGGAYAPNQGWFPKYDKGEFDINGTKMIISAGLGNNANVPRFNNCPELAVVDIK